MDFWGPLPIDPGTIGGVRNPITNSHTLASEIASRQDLSATNAGAFQTVYTSQNKEGFITVLAIGIAQYPATRESVGGISFNNSSEIHYANGTCGGPMTYELIVSDDVARRVNLSVGDTLYVGGTISSARDRPFRVTKIAGAFSQTLGTPTIVLHLSELQEIVGKTGTDRASYIAVSVTQGTPPRSVKENLEQTYPELDIRTQTEQLQSVIGR
jgi:putative ABC transport system permease protein